MKALKQKKLSPELQKMINAECQKTVSSLAERLATGYDAEVLWALYCSLGFKKHRLRKFYEDFGDALKKVEEYYEFQTATAGHEMSDYCIVRELKEIGVDLPYWRKQKGNWNPEKDECWQSHGNKKYRCRKKDNI